MSLVQQISDSIELELTICQHLYTKLDPKYADWRPLRADGTPHPEMRPTIHLMQYLCFIGRAMIRHLIDPPADRSKSEDVIRELSAWSGEAVTFENFPERIEEEKKEIREALSKLTDADLTRITYHPNTRQDITLFEGLTNIQIKYFAAYRNQLFLYAKMCGANINTMNNWFGVDAPMPQ